MTTNDELKEIIKKKQLIIDRLSRKIQKKNQKYKKLQQRKQPPTLFGSKVILVPDNKLKDIVMVDEKFMRSDYFE